MIILISGLSCREGHDLHRSLVSNDILVLSCVFDNCNDISNEEGSDGVQLPDILVIPPGTYNVDGVEIDVSTEGLLRILFIGQKNIQRIVFRNDTTALLSAISWIVTHGNSDKNKSFVDMNVKAMSDKLYLTCGPITDWALNTLRSLNINAREVMTLTLKPWNNYDNGHNMIEVEMNGRWLLFDLDNGVFFKRQGKILDLVCFRDAVRENDYEICSLSKDIPVQSNINQGKNYNFDFYYEARFISQDNLRRWYKKVVDAIFIEANDSMYFRNFSEKEINQRILSYSGNIRSIDSSQFINKFYKSRN